MLVLSDDVYTAWFIQYEKSGPQHLMMSLTKKKKHQVGKEKEACLPGIFDSTTGYNYKWWSQQLVLLFNRIHEFSTVQLTFSLHFQFADAGYGERPNAISCVTVYCLTYFCRLTYWPDIVVRISNFIKIIEKNRVFNCNQIKGNMHIRSLWAKGEKMGG